MKRLTLQTQNNWRYVKDGGPADLIHIGFAVSRWYVNVCASLFGFGVGLTLWLKQPELSSWGGVVGEAVKTYAWEPIETDGWAGDPQGREKAP
jgi:hypothetical protein